MKKVGAFVRVYVICCVTMAMASVIEELYLIFPLMIADYVSILAFSSVHIGAR